MSAIVRSITHWTGGAGRASALDKKHYHRITEHDGTIVEGDEEIADNVVTSDGDYAAHTLNLNTGSGGFSMAGMAGAKESPFDAGQYPINEKQFEAHCKMLAGFHTEYSILPITPENCLTHAEVQGTLGVKQRGKWDFTRIPFKPELVGAKACGDYLRERVNFYLGAVPASPFMNRPILRLGMHGDYVKDLQSGLANVGFFAGKKDGKFGERTKAAVVAFQSHEGLPADGVVGALTWKALYEAEPLPERDVDVAELRAEGSGTIKAADKGQGAAAVGAVVAGASGVLEAVSGATQSLTEAETALEIAQRLAVTYWPVLAGLLACALIWYLFDSIKRKRVADARSGRHMGR